MEIFDNLNILIKSFITSILVYFVAIKILNDKHNNKKQIILYTFVSFIIFTFYTIFIKYMQQVLCIIIAYLGISILFASLMNKNLITSIITIFISLSIIYLFLMVSIIIVVPIIKFIIPEIQFNNIIIFIVAVLFEVLILNLIFKIKRLKNGFSFLKEADRLNNINLLGVLLISAIILIASILGTYNNHIANTYFVLVMFLNLICMVIWIKRKITKFYKQKLKEQTIESLENEIKEKDKIIFKISEENKAIAKINHKYSNRINALEKFSHKMLTLPEFHEKFNTEFGEEFIEFKKQIEEISKEYFKEVEENIKHPNVLPKTGIFGIDNLLEYMNSEAIKSDISFNVQINEDINELIETKISQNKLETLLGDHLKDAIIAINFSENTEKEINLKIMKHKEKYEIAIADTGINFKIETLIKLGKEQTTTHLATGGSGIGFITTFNTLKETGASLEIEELQNSKYTKFIKIIFDNKNEYRIKTYRREAISKQDKEKRIIIN